ncbi:hypothetical protein AOR10_24135, partial [Vibrio alginolyticus]
RGQAYAVVEDDADQLGQGGRAVAGTAQRRGQRRHQVGEGVAQPLPATLDLGEGLGLEHGADA